MFKLISSFIGGILFAALYISYNIGVDIRQDSKRYTFSPDTWIDCVTSVTTERFILMLPLGLTVQLPAK